MKLMTWHRFARARQIDRTPSSQTYTSRAQGLLKFGIELLEDRTVPSLLHVAAHDGSPSVDSSVLSMQADLFNHPSRFNPGATIVPN